MKRRLGAVAIVLVALTALAGVLSYVFFLKKVPQNSNSQSQAVEGAVSPSSSSSSSTTTSSVALRADQPAELKPTAFVRDPSWHLLDWSVKTFVGKPGVQLRASSWAASGKHSFIRVEEQIQRDVSGKIQVLHIKEMVGDQIIVKLPEGATQENAETMAAKIGARAGSRPFAPETWLFKLERKLEAVPEGMKNLKSSGGIIDYTEPDLIVRPAKLPNDPKVTDFTTWHLYNSNTNQLDKDIKAAKAWDRRTSALYVTNGVTNKVVVAVIDTGVRYTHEDLSANMWKNPGETGTDTQGRNKATNGVDDDGNGWVDDIYGIDAYGTEDFTDSNFNALKDPDTQPGWMSNAEPFNDANKNGIWDTDVDPMDENGHGSHCAGEIGAVGNNGIGLSGIAWTGLEIMALRFIGATGSLSDEVLCMDYARLKGAKVINASFGQDGGQSQTEVDAITRLNNSGVILVAAAGNGGTDYIGDNNNGSTPFYPASYTNNNIIAVGATDQNDNKSTYSNYGATAVDIFAPGDSIYACGTGADNSYFSGNGTSFAAPIVTGAIALLIAEYPSDTVSQRVARVVSTNAVDIIPALNGLCFTGGRLNLGKLLPAADPSTLPPALAWHRPEYQEPLINSPMRTPTNAVYPNTLTVYSGLKKFNNTNGSNTNWLVNQNGGWLFYRTSPTASWASNSLTWHTTTNDYQFWKGVISNIPAGNYQYYLQLDFDSGARTTFSYYTNNTNGFATTTNPVTAQSSPYTLTVSKANATISITGTNQTYNGSARTVAISTTPSNLVTATTYNSNSSAPTNAGSYAVIATVNDSNYQGSASNVLTVAKALASLVIGNTNQTYNGLARSVSVTTTPTNLASTVTYNGLATAPVDPGLYAISAAINEMNYEGSASASLTIGGISNPTGDTNNNGQPDLLEYALTGSSAISTNGATAGFITPQTTGANSSNLIIMTALVRTNDPKLTYTPKASVDLSSTNWLTNGFTTNTSNQANVPAGFQRREYQFNAGTNQRAFLKLTIEQK